MSSHGKNFGKYAQQALSKAGEYAWNNRAAIKAAAMGIAKRGAQRAVAAQVLRNQGTITKINKIVSCEERYQDTSITAVSTVNTGTFQYFNLMAQGDGDASREGQCIGMKSFQLTTTLFPNSSTSNGGNTVRMIVFIDKQANGAAATMADLLEVTTALVNQRSYRNQNKKSRFIILHDKVYSTYTQPNTGATPGAGVAHSPIKTIKKYWSWKKLKKVMYNGNAGTIADIVSGALGTLMIARADSLTQHEQYGRLIYEP